ncbi:UNVERIFIED_CONTAM: hypothetical protein RMT77_016613 [Armadillidium vulgare]
MSSSLLKHLFKKSVHSVWNANFVCLQRSITDFSKIYVVVQGREPGIYSSWEECQLQVNNFKGMRFKKFSNKEDALLYFEKSINIIETLHPKKKKSVKHLKNILNQYKEKWKNNNKDVETTPCKFFEDSETKLTTFSRFCALYSDKYSSNKEEYETAEANEFLGNSDLVYSLVENAEDRSHETGLSSFHLKSESKLEFETEVESNLFTNCEHEKHKNNGFLDFNNIYNRISYNDENYKDVRDEFNFCRNLSAILENSTEIYDAFRSLGIEQQEEVERLYASQSSEACKNSEKKEKKVLGYSDFSNILSNACDDGEENPFNTESANSCSSTSIFSEKNTTNDDEEFPPHLFDMEKIQKVEYKSFEESCMSSDGGESIVDGYLQLYTDGGCYNNGKENAYGAVGIYFGRGSKLNTSVMLEGKVTNNIAEIKAAYLGLQKAYENGFRKVKLFTDSHYVVMCCSHWLKGWKKNNWKKANGRPVLNQEELEYLDEAISKMDDVQMVFVRGHQGIEGNEYADKLARDCISASRSDLNKDIN